MSNPSRFRVTGPLVAYAAGFRAELEAQGYRRKPVIDQLYVLAHVSRWLESKGLGPWGFTRERSLEFLAERREAGYTLWLSEKGVAPLLVYLRQVGAAPIPAPPAPTTPAERLLAEFRTLLGRRARPGARNRGERRARGAPVPRHPPAGRPRASKSSHPPRSSPSSKSKARSARPSTSPRDSAPSCGSAMSRLERHGRSPTLSPRSPPGAWRGSRRPSTPPRSGPCSRAATGERPLADATSPCSCSSPAWAFVPAKSHHCVWRTSTGEPGSSWSGARAPSSSDSRCRPMSARRWPPGFVEEGQVAPPGRSSRGSGRRTER